MWSKQEQARACELVRQSQKDRFGKGALAIVAGELDKTFRTWSAECSPFDGNHKLGLFDVLNTLDITGNFQELFSFLLDHYNYHIAPNPGAKLPTKDLFQLLTQSTAESGDIARKLAESVNPNSPGGSDISPEEADQLLKEVDDQLQVLNRMKSVLQEMV